QLGDLTEHVDHVLFHEALCGEPLGESGQTGGLGGLGHARYILVEIVQWGGVHYPLLTAGGGGAERGRAAGRVTVEFRRACPAAVSAAVSRPAADPFRRSSIVSESETPLPSPSSADQAPETTEQTPEPASPPRPGPKPPVPSPTVLAGQRPTAALLPAAPPMAGAPTLAEYDEESLAAWKPFWLVAEDGTVTDQDGTQVRTIGTTPESDHDQALAPFARAYLDLVAFLDLTQKKLTAPQHTLNELNRLLENLRKNMKEPQVVGDIDRKSTRLNSSHVSISYAVFCLKKKIKQRKQHTTDT